MAKNGYFLENVFGRILSPFERFLRRTTAGGIILVGTSVITLILANSGAGEHILHILEQPARIGVAGYFLEMSVHAWINDGLMALFFLLVGLELKRELLVGELSSLRDAALPVVAALGGMVVPALIYYAINPTGPTARGWGIPMATDIAFAVGILVLLAWRVPQSLIIFLTALAIADDLGAVLVIALFYTGEIAMEALAAAAAILIALLVVNRGGIRHPFPYGVLGVLLWLALLKSGVHPTIAGVLLAFTIPARPAYTPIEFTTRIDQIQEKMREEEYDPNACDHPLGCPQMMTVAENIEKTARAVQAPQQRMEHSLSPWVTFVVLPIFAFSNLAIDFSKLDFGASLSPITAGVCLGLIPGKFIGVSLFSWLAVKLKIGKLPSGVRWRQLLGVAWLAGIGFTMSLFVTNLAFTETSRIEEAKVGILVASLLAGAVGLAWLYLGKGKR